MKQKGIQNGPWLSFGDTHFYVGDFVFDESSGGELLPDPLLYSDSSASRAVPNLRTNPGKAVSRGPDSVGWRIIARSAKICYRYYLGEGRLAVLTVETSGHTIRPQHKRGFMIKGTAKATLSSSSNRWPENANVNINRDEIGQKLEELNQLKKQIEGSLKAVGYNGLKKE